MLAALYPNVEDTSSNNLLCFIVYSKLLLTVFEYSELKKRFAKPSWLPKTSTQLRRYVRVIWQIGILRINCLKCPSIMDFYTICHINNACHLLLTNCQLLLTEKKYVKVHRLNFQKKRKSSILGLKCLSLSVIV